MTVDWAVLPVLGIIFLAMLTRSALGFGDALVAVPLLAFLIPITVATPLAVLLSITVAAVVLAQDWRHVHVGSAWRLALATLAGIPLGLLLLVGTHEHVVKAGLAVVIIAFSVFCLVRRNGVGLTSDLWAWPFGFVAGVLGAAYAMNGPPLVIYGALRRWSAGHFRATLQGYFLPAGLACLGSYWLAGLWVPAVTRYYLLSLPVLVVGVVLGRVINRRLEGQRFLVYIYGGLIVVGAGLLVQALWQ